MLSAMGTFDERLNGSIRVDDNFRSEDVSPYQSDFRPQHKLNQQNLQLLSQNMFSHDEAQRRNQASWPHQTLKVTNNDNAADTGGGPFSAQSSSQVAQEPTKQAGPKSLASESIIDAWRTSPKVLEHPSSTCTDIQKEEMRRISNQSREIIDESSSQQSQSKSASFDKSTVQISDYHEKDVEKPSLRVSEKNTRTESNVWATKSISASASTISKSLKDIQKEEQREMLSKMSSDNSEDKNLAQMGVQLKMMLGVNSVAAHRTSSAPVATSVARSHVASTSMSITPVTSAWGTTATITKKNDSKSMRDILAEEERLALERAKANENAPTSSHWMNIVAGNKIAAAVIPKSTRSSLGPIPASVLKSRQQVRVVNGAAKPVVSKADNDASFWNFGAVQSADSGYVSTNVSNGSSNAFGKKIVSSEFMGWALKQLQTINSNADGTLLEYLASVEDPGEIREYLAAYLGSTPRVSAFATEFIQRKKSQSDGKKSQGEQDANQRAFEAGSSNKRGKRRLKSHKIDPSLLNYSVGS
ncbi:uncharacterized protein PHALS_01680 [Plasmopara halstedii]|uniref:Uncharacterized protein n=1 Tax=Plasmopara halstedii TaxID=4781 RepID=A0A0N7L6W1_PLAHL|nr:uncharacterized protein PHALS_01680 [Plasmopara halstedii]CEG45379.1 hypothetical protein PHALS_01680 [Plasmopara halstedii]|eukprot:XP_024581748.1 hypothetical protein PHALS_01680 [Plasmopara halstedii]